MLSAKPWRSDAVARLILGVFVCIFTGALMMALVHQLRKGVAAWGLFVVAGGSLVFLGAALVSIRKAWMLDNLARRMGLFMVWFYLGLILGLWAIKLAGPATGSVVQMLVATLSFQGAGLVLVGCFLREHQVGWREAFGLGPPWLVTTLIGVVTGLFFLPIGWGLQNLSALGLDYLQAWWPGGALSSEEQQSVQTLRVAEVWVDRFALGGVTILLAPVGEEVLFRGILYPWIKQLGYPVLALWLTSVLFAGMHLNAATFVPLLALALVLARLYEHTRNLLAPIAAHCVFNALNFIILYLTQKSLG